MNSKVVISGIKWTTIQFGLDSFFRFIIQLFIARKLLPDQYGLIGMCSIFLALANVASELGMGDALIQKANNEEAEKMYSTVFWSGTILGGCIFLAVSFIVGPFVAYFYNEPLLARIIPALSLGILIRPLNLIHIVILTRNMDFKVLANIYNASSLLAGILSLVGAYWFNLGVWALVINSILAVVISCPILLWITKWMPKLEWEILHFKKVFNFGMYTSGTKVFSTITYNLDNLLIGKFLGTSQLGSYSLAFGLTEQLRQAFSSILNKVLFPVYGKKQNDIIFLKTYFLHTIRFNAVIIYPLMTFFLFFAERIILELFGVKWQESIIILQILSLAMMIHLLINSFTTLLRGIGLPSLEMKIIMASTLIILLPGLFIGINLYGILGASIAVLINKFFLVVLGFRCLKDRFKLKLAEVFLAVRSVMISVSISSIIGIILSNVFHTISLSVLIIIFFGSYLLIIYLFEKNTFIKLIKTIL